MLASSSTDKLGNSEGTTKKNLHPPPVSKVNLAISKVAFTKISAEQIPDTKIPIGIKFYKHIRLLIHIWSELLAPNSLQRGQRFWPLVPSGTRAPSSSTAWSRLASHCSEKTDYTPTGRAKLYTLANAMAISLECFEGFRLSLVYKLEMWHGARQ